MKELKATDLEMLRILLQDGRTSFKKIAQEIHTSQDAILTRYRQLQKAGLITGATAQINYQILGYTGIATMLLRVDSQNFQDTWNRMEKIPNIGRWFYRAYGSSYNIAKIFVLKNLRDLEHIKQIIHRQNKITASQTYIWMDVRNTPENMIRSPSDENEPSKDHILRPVTKNFKIDQFDSKIMEILNANGRLSFNKIAKMIGLSTQTVARRYKVLKDNNVLRVKIQINPILLGYQVWAEFTIALNDPNEINQVANNLGMIPGVYLVVKVNGSFDLSAGFVVKSFADFFSIEKRIYEIPNIKRVENYFYDMDNPSPTQGEITSTF
jgi:DNA-binding Lrp family transcriptional regulator